MRLFVDAKVGRRGLKDITTIWDGDAKGAKYIYRDGTFVNPGGQEVDGFTLQYTGGYAKVYLSPNVAALRMGVSDYMITNMVNGKVDITCLSARYASALGHELIHAKNWFNLHGSYGAAYKAYDENAAYTFSMRVYRMQPMQIDDIRNALNANGWNTSHPSFSTSPVFK